MRAVVVESLSGPRAVVLRDIPSPAGAHRRANGRRVLIEVHAAGLSFIDPLQTRGRYQAGVDPPYVCGSELAGKVLEAPSDSWVKPGDRVCGIVWQGAMAASAGATYVVRTDGSEGPWLERVRSLTDGRGAHVFVDQVGADMFLDLMRALRIGGRGVVVGFTGGAIPEVRVNRLLLRNLTLTGITMDTMETEYPGTLARVGDGVQRLLDAGKLHPAIGAIYPLVNAADALASIEERSAVGKVVVEVRSAKT